MLVGFELFLVVWVCAFRVGATQEKGRSIRIAQLL
jgi:hypothetical protein